MRQLADLEFDAGVTLTLGQDPTSDLHAATKQYVDDAVAAEALYIALGLAEVLTAGENLTANRIVFVDSANDTVYHADADNSRPCNGYVLESVTSGNPVTVYYAGTPSLNVSGFGGSAGDNLYISTTAGFVSLAPATGGNIVQHVGVAVSPASGLPSAMKVRFSPSEWT